MLYVLMLVTLLVFMAGVIAYAGDVLGTTVGRRRLSLFGWRPKRTGQVVGVAAGILIMLTTLGISALAFRGAASALLNAQRTAQTLEGLQAEQRRLESDIGSLERQLGESQTLLSDANNELAAFQEELTRVREALEDAEAQRQEALRAGEQLREQNAALEAQNSELFEQNSTLQRQNSLLTESNGELEANLLALTSQIADLDNQVNSLRARLEEQAQALVRAQANTIQSDTPTYRQGEIVYSGLVAAGEDNAIRTELSEFVQEANRETLRRGAGAVTLRNDQVDGLIEAVAASPGADLVVLLSPTNQSSPTQVVVEVEAYENRQLLSEGQLVVSRPIHLGSSELPARGADLRSEVAALVTDATEILRRLGLFEAVRPALVSLSEETFVSQLSRLTGPVVIGLVAAEPVYSGGPAPLELIILR